MDLLPSLGEPGIFDELFYFGPLALQLILGFVFFRITGRWLKIEHKAERALNAAMMVLGVDVLLLAIFIIIGRNCLP